MNIQMKRNDVPYNLKGFRDKGQTTMLPCGCVRLLVLFSGWRNLVLSVPGYQATSYRSSAMSGVTCTFGVICGMS